MAAAQQGQRQDQIPVPSVLFSVVIPAYNAELYLASSLDSVARQTFADYEIVVVDDGSTDGTAHLVRAWAGEHPRISLRLVQQENRGIGSARNAGVHVAVGTYVAFLDADDLWFEGKLEAVARYLGRAPFTEVVCHDVWMDEGNGRPSLIRRGPYTSYRDLLFRGNCLSTLATVVRRECLLAVGGFSSDLRFNSVEDYDLWLRLARAGFCITYLHEILGIYRVHGQGITASIESHCEHGLNVLEAHFAEWPIKTPYYRYLMHRRRASILRGAARAFVKRGDHAKAGQFVGRALREDPLAWKVWALGVLSLIRVSL